MLDSGQLPELFVFSSVGYPYVVLQCQYIHAFFPPDLSRPTAALCRRSRRLSLYGHVVPVPMSPTAYKQPCLLQLFLLKMAYFLKYLDLSVGIWLFGSFLVWQLGVYSPSSFLGSFTVIVYMCWMFLSSPQDGNMLALGRRYVLQLLFQLILHLVTVHQTLQQCELCLSLLLILGYLTLENFRLNLPGPCPVMNILCISWEVTFQLLKTVRRKTCCWSTHYTIWPVPLSAPKTCLFVENLFVDLPGWPC